MTVVEFLGGPLDGRVTDLQDTPPVYYVAVPLKVSPFVSDEEFMEPRHLQYYRNRFRGGEKDGRIVYTVRPYGL